MVLTTKHFASENKFIGLSQTFNKIKVINGDNYFESPFKCKKVLRMKTNKDSSKLKIIAQEEIK